KAVWQPPPSAACRARSRVTWRAVAPSRAETYFGVSRPRVSIAIAPWPKAGRRQDRGFGLARGNLAQAGVDIAAENGEAGRGKEPHELQPTARAVCGH